MKKLLFKFLIHTNRATSIALFGFPVLLLIYIANKQITKEAPVIPDTNVINKLAGIVPVDPHATPWETIQTMYVEQKDKSLPPVKLNLDQVRNGSGTSPLVVGNWQNGNAGASNAHYVEGWSIPYRVIIENLVGNGVRSVDIEWDIRHSSANAIDFITNYDLIDYPAGSHLFNFAHLQEQINPLINDGIGFSSGTSPFIIKPNLPAIAPNPGAGPTFEAIKALGDKGKFGIWNADIVSMEFVGSQGDLNAAQSSTRLRIFFNNSAPTVILAWGGHIAKEADWGTGQSAVAVSGSPYHTRLLQWDSDDNIANGVTSIGNQDRSLSADAVLDPPVCNLTGSDNAVCNTTEVYNSGLQASDLSSGVSIEWSFISNTSGASFNGSTSGFTVSVNTGTGCGTSFTLKVALIKNMAELSHCMKTVTVTDNIAPVITCPTAPTSPINCPATPLFGTATATDNCSTPTITSSDADAPGSCAGTYTRTRKWTATDACGNTSTCAQSVTVRDITPPVFGVIPGPSTIDCPANPTFTTPTATDACSGTSVTITSSDQTSTSCGNARTVTRKWTATDACGNTATASQAITVRDITPPVIYNVGNNSDLGCNPSAVIFSSPSASDACNTPTLTSSDGDIQSSTCSRSRTRTWTATDACGNTSTASQTLTWKADTDPPVISGVGTNTPLGCNPTAFPFSSPSASDACGAITFTSSTGTDVAGASCSVSRTRTWTARDGCGNTATASQTLSWTADVTPPTFTFCPAGGNLGCNPTGIPAAGTATATDNCAGTPGITNSLAGEVNTGGCNYSRTRTYTATDGCGNTATCAQTYTYVKDMTPPVFTSCQPDVVVECGSPTSSAAIGAATATDACGTPTVTASDAQTSVGCQTVITRTWTARDGCNNTATCVQRILIIDRTPPVITCDPATGNATASDACGSYYLYQNGTKWTAIDASGNTSTANCTVVSARINNSNTAPDQENTDPLKDEKQKTEEATRSIVPPGSGSSILTVQAVPNPFNDKVKFVINSSAGGLATLDVLNMVGQKIKTVYTGQLPAGQQSFEMTLPTGRYQTLIYILKVNDQQVTGKLVQASSKEP